MTATVIVAVFSALSAGSYGARDSFSGLIASLSAYRFLLGIGVRPIPPLTSRIFAKLTKIICITYHQFDMYSGWS